MFWKEFFKMGLTRKRLQLQHEPVLNPMELNNYFVPVSGGEPLPSFNEFSANTQFTSREDQLCFCEVDLLNVKDAVKRISACARGADGISTQEYKAMLEVLLPLIVALFNSSIRNSVFPSLWKCLVKPLPKGKHPSTALDYHPIALLCALSKVLERTIHDQIVINVKS